MTRITQQQLESYLWGAAVLLRGTIDAGDYKQFIFPLLFYKRLCDVFDEEVRAALAESGGDEAFALFPENHRFQVPVDAHWREIRKVSRDVGRGLQQAIEALVLDADVLDGILNDANPAKKAREVEIRLIARLKKHAGNPKFKELGERLEKIREKHEQGLLNSLEFLKAILEVAKDTVEAEKNVEPEEEQDRALSALTDLFNEVKSKHTHVIVERIVADIDAIVKSVRFPDWQTTSQGEREVRQVLRRTLLKYKLHTDQELFDKAYGYIRQYY